jgi:hypothetical protein
MLPPDWKAGLSVLIFGLAFATIFGFGVYFSVSAIDKSKYNSFLIPVNFTYTSCTISSTSPDFNIMTGFGYINDDTVVEYSVALSNVFSVINEKPPKCPDVNQTFNYLFDSYYRYVYTSYSCVLCDAVISTVLIIAGISPVLFALAVKIYQKTRPVFPEETLREPFLPKIEQVIATMNDTV